MNLDLIFWERKKGTLGSKGLRHGSDVWPSEYHKMQLPSTLPSPTPRKPKKIHPKKIYISEMELSCSNIKKNPYIFSNESFSNIFLKQIFS